MMTGLRAPTVVVFGKLYSMDALPTLNRHTGVIETSALDDLPAAVLSTVRAIIVRYPNRIKDKHIRAMPLLDAIVTSGSGSDNVDVQTAQDAGVRVVTCRGVNARSVAEHTLALILGLTRRVDQQFRSPPQGFWGSMGLADRIELAGTQVGVLGMGAVGSRVAELCGALGADVLAYDLVPEKTTSGVATPCESMQDLFGQARVVSIHVPLMPETNGLVSQAEIQAMQPSSYLVCTSRGGIVDEDAITDALRSGHLAGVALDVYRDEPLPSGSPLWQVPNLLMTPHVADATEQCRRAMAFAAVRQCLDVLRLADS